MSKFLKDANAQYATLANTLKTVEAKTKTVGKSEQGLTALQKERARVAKQTRTVFAGDPHHVTQRGNFREGVFLPTLPGKLTSNGYLGICRSLRY